MILANDVMYCNQAGASEFARKQTEEDFYAIIIFRLNFIAVYLGRFYEHELKLFVDFADCEMIQGISPRYHLIESPKYSLEVSLFTAGHQNGHTKLWITLRNSTILFAWKWTMLEQGSKNMCEIKRKVLKRATEVSNEQWK